MTVVTLRPNGSSGTMGTTVTGAASAHAALSDNSDSSYVNLYAGVQILLQYDDLTLPAGAVLASTALRLRTAKVSGSPHFMAQFTWPTTVPTYVNVGTTSVTWATPTTFVLVQKTGLVDSDVDGIGSGLFSTAPDELLVYETYVDATYAVKPVTAPSAPTGTVTTTNKPQVAWANTLDADGGAQTAYDVKVFSAAQYGAGGFDPSTSTPTTSSGVTASSAATWDPAATIADGTYRAYVRVAQTVNGTYHWSDWAYTAFTTLVDLPAVPTLTLTAENTSGRIKIDSIHNAGTATTTANEIQRSVDNVTWEPLRLTTDTDGVTYSPDATVYDYEAGNGQTVYYRARALHDYSGVFAASAWATANTSWSSTAWWLKCPLSPVLNTLVYPHAVESFTRRARQGIFQALGASEAIVVSDTREARTGQITLRLDTDEEIVALDALLDSGETLLLNAPAGDHFPDRYVALGDLDRERIADKAFIEGTLDSLQWTEVVVAAGVVDAWPTGLAPSETLAPSTSLAPAA